MRIRLKHFVFPIAIYLCVCAGRSINCPFGPVSLGDAYFDILTCLMSTEGRLVISCAVLSCFIYLRSNFSGLWVIVPAIQMGTLPMFAHFLWSTSADFQKMWLVIAVFILLNLLMLGQYTKKTQSIVEE